MQLLQSLNAEMDNDGELKLSVNRLRTENLWESDEFDRMPGKSMRRMIFAFRDWKAIVKRKQFAQKTQALRSVRYTQRISRAFQDWYSCEIHSVVEILPKELTLLNQ